MTMRRLQCRGVGFKLSSFSIPDSSFSRLNCLEVCLGKIKESLHCEWSEEKTKVVLSMLWIWLFFGKWDQLNVTNTFYHSVGTRKIIWDLQHNMLHRHALKLKSTHFLVDVLTQISGASESSDKVIKDFHSPLRNIMASKPGLNQLFMTCWPSLLSWLRWYLINYRIFMRVVKWASNSTSKQIMWI